jgi:hypothetical protein
LSARKVGPAGELSTNEGGPVGELSARETDPIDELSVREISVIDLTLPQGEAKKQRPSEIQADPGPGWDRGRRYARPPALAALGGDAQVAEQDVLGSQSYLLFLYGVLLLLAPRCRRGVGATGR